MNSIVIASNTIKRLLREISSLSFLIIFPVLAAVLAMLMYGSSGVVELGIANISENDFSLVNYLEQSGKYHVQFIKDDSLEEKVKNKEIKAGITFPDNFVDLLANGKLDQLKLVVAKDDGEIQELSGIIEMYMASAVKGQYPTAENRLEDNKIEQGKTAIGMLTMFIIMFAGNGMVFLLEDKKLNTFARTYCAPLRGYEVVLGQLMANTMLGVIQIIIFLFFATVVFKIQWGASLLSIFAILFVYMIAAIGLAIGLVGFIKDSEKYNMAIMLTALSTSFIGGSFFPTEYLNEFIKKIANFVPQKWVMDSYVKLTQGGTLMDIQMNLFILLLFGIV
ncbi:MAG: ABC transporter permease, partial [Clostridia bacterium]|nr:ABC transporter permease [Clostridia bacterium]